MDSHKIDEDMMDGFDRDGMDEVDNDRMDRADVDGMDSLDCQLVIVLSGISRCRCACRVFPDRRVCRRLYWLSLQHQNTAAKQGIKI